MVKHLGGETRIPANSERVAVLEPLLADTLLALELRPVGVVNWTGGDTVKGYLPHIADELEGVALLGESWPTLNLEAVLAVRPDLIIGPSWLTEIYDQLSSIAPTILFDSGDWQSEIVPFGRTLGRETEAEAVLASYRTKAAEAQARLEETVGDETVMVLAPFNRELRVYGNQRQFGRVLYRDLRLTPPQGALIPDDNIRVISEEILPELNPNHIFLIVLDDEAETAAAELSRSPLWQNLTAVRNGNVYTIPWTLNLTAPMLNSWGIDVALENLTGESE